MSVDRRGFLLRAGAFVGALVVARVPQLEELVEQAPVVEQLAAARPFPPASLVASGGLCAPVTPYYSLVMRERPVGYWPLRDALPEFKVIHDASPFDA